MVHHQIQVWHNINAKILEFFSQSKEEITNHYISTVFSLYYLIAGLQCLISISFCHSLLPDLYKMSAKPST